MGAITTRTTVVVPGGWASGLAFLSGDDTFTSTSSPTRPNLSQLYLSLAKNWRSMSRMTTGHLYGFRVTAADGTPDFDPEDRVQWCQ